MRRRRSTLLLALAACLLLGACAHDESDSGRGRQSGFYGGFSGGTAMP